MSIVTDLAMNEVKYCEEIELERNEHGQFIYDSRNGKSSISMAYILLSYKEWLIENKIVKELK